MASKIPFCFTSCARIFCRTIWRNSRQEEFEVPQCFRDNKVDVMMAVCSKRSENASKQASSRLHMLTKIWSQQHNGTNKSATQSFDMFPNVSYKGQEDVFECRMIVGYYTPLFTRAWLVSLDPGRMKIKEQKEIDMPHHIAWLLTLWTKHNRLFCFLSKFSQELCDDASFRLPFVNSIVRIVFVATRILSVQCCCFTRTWTHTCMARGPYPYITI